MQWTFGTIAILAKRERQLCSGGESARDFRYALVKIDLRAPEDNISLQSPAYSTLHLQKSQTSEGSQLAHKDLSLLHVGRSHPFSFSPFIHFHRLLRFSGAVEGFLFVPSPLSDEIRGSPTASSLALTPQLSSRLVSVLRGPPLACIGAGSTRQL